MSSAWVFLVALSLGPTPDECPVGLEVTVLDAGAVSPEDLRQSLQAELRRPVQLGAAGACDLVSLIVDVGVVTIRARARGEREGTRLLPRTPQTSTVQEATWLAAGLLRSQLEAHLRGLADSSPPPPPPSPEPEPKPADTSIRRWWVDVATVVGTPARANLSLGLELGGHFSSDLFRVGLAAMHSQGVQAPEVAVRWQVLAEAGLHGEPGRLRLALLFGAGLLAAKEPRPSDPFELAAALRPRALLGFALTPKLELSATGGVVFAVGAAAFPLHFFFGALNLSYGFGE